MLCKIILVLNKLTYHTVSEFRQIYYNTKCISNIKCVKFLHLITSSFRSTCPYHCKLFCCCTEIISSNPSLSLNSSPGTLSFTLMPHIHLTTLISACWSANSFSFLTGQVSAFSAFAFSALTLLVGRQEGQKTEWWDAGMVICLRRGADLHMAQMMPLPLTVSYSNKSRLVLP